ncbi:hypothetical protein [Microcoleus sp. F4-D5]|uniref:hypothetical protein n=1 Tax=Microcoleus sp. F4-D5 TaxID=2818760 RepID=UPI002FD393BE
MPAAPTAATVPDVPTSARRATAPIVPDLPAVRSPRSHPIAPQCRSLSTVAADRPVSIGLPPILESYWWKTLLNSADIKACLAFAADHEKTDPPWLLSTSGLFFYPYLLKPEILT